METNTLFTVSKQVNLRQDIQIYAASEGHKILAIALLR